MIYRCTAHFLQAFDALDTRGQALVMKAMRGFFRSTAPAQSGCAAGARNAGVGVAVRRQPLPHLFVHQ